VEKSGKVSVLQTNQWYQFYIANFVNYSMVRVIGNVLIYLSLLTTQTIHANGSSVFNFCDSVPAHKKEFPYRTAIAAGMLTYGLIALKSPGLESVNATVTRTVGKAEGNRLFSLDDFLPAVPMVAIYGLKFSGIKGEHTIGQTAVINGIALVIANGVALGGKAIRSEMRPDSSNTRSFPSQHTANAFANAEVMRREFRDESPWYGVAGYTVAFATGYMRMYNRKHWFNDVIAGAGIGILSTQLAYIIYPATKRLFTGTRDTGKLILFPCPVNSGFGMYVSLTID
jgi:membrane-associated phospholipid phosphatase